MNSNTFRIITLTLVFATHTIDATDHGQEPTAEPPARAAIPAEVKKLGRDSISRKSTADFAVIRGVLEDLHTSNSEKAEALNSLILFLTQLEEYRKNLAFPPLNWKSELSTQESDRLFKDAWNLVLEQIENGIERGHVPDSKTLSKLTVPPDQLRAWVSKIKSKSPLLRKLVLQVIARPSYPHETRKLLSAIVRKLLEGEPDDSVRSAGVKALGRLHFSSPETIEALEMEMERSGNIRDTADAMLELGPTPAATSLAKKLREYAKRHPAPESLPRVLEGLDAYDRDDPNTQKFALSLFTDPKFAQNPSYENARKRAFVLLTDAGALPKPLPPALEAAKNWHSELSDRYAKLLTYDAGPEVRDLSIAEQLFNEGARSDYKKASTVARDMGQLTFAAKLGFRQGREDSLIDAASTGRVDLLEENKDKMTPDKAAVALIYAAQGKQPDSVDYLTKRFPDLPLNAAYRVAATNGDLKSMQILQEKGADPKEDLAASFIGALNGGHRHVLESLLDAGFNPGAAMLRSAAIAAADQRDSPLLKRLIEAGAAQEDSAVLEGAIIAGDSEAVKLCLGRGANANSKHTLSIAAASGHVAILNLLLDAKADVHQQSDGPIRSAATSGMKDAFELLLNRGADPEAGLIAAAAAGQPTMVNLALAKGANIDVRGGAALAGAVFSGQVETAMKLLDAGASIETVRTHKHPAEILEAAGKGREALLELARKKRAVRALE